MLGGVGNNPNGEIDDTCDLNGNLGIGETSNRTEIEVESEAGAYLTGDIEASINLSPY